jgi:hypothetical protein
MDTDILGEISGKYQWGFLQADYNYEIPAATGMIVSLA